MRYQAAAQTGEAELLQVVEDFRGYYPDDVCLDFLLVDYHVLRKEHDKALEAIDRLDASVGGDTHLNLLRPSPCTSKATRPRHSSWCARRTRPTPTRSIPIGRSWACP